jgi:hypothetical protein
MTTETKIGVSISLEAACDFPECAGFAFPLHRQLSDGYETCSVLPITSLKEWRAGHRTARKRADHAKRLGYAFREIAREEYDEDIFQINTSKTHRQGRRMTAAYRERTHFLPLPEYPCPRHGIWTYGVLDARGTLVAYLWLYRSGDMALVSSILGHGEHEPKDVMYLLFEGVLSAQAGNDGYFVYNRHDSGTEGLRYFKSKLGFVPMEVAWEL